LRAAKETKMVAAFRIVEINGGEVESPAAGRPDEWLLGLPAVSAGYADAQIDDYGGLRRRAYPWRRGARLRVEARFTPGEGTVVGTAGFGFWNAPFGPGTGLLPALPQAVWFFYGSPRNDLPLAPAGEAGNGWFAATIDAGAPRALAIAPLAPPVLLLNQLPALGRRIWPLVRRALRISFSRLPQRMDEWHAYELAWTGQGCIFRVDGGPVLQTTHSPRGPLGFVAWIDNQYMVATPAGRFRWGVEPVLKPQSLTLRGLRLEGA